MFQAVSYTKNGQRVEECTKTVWEHGEYGIQQVTYKQEKITKAIKKDKRGRHRYLQ